MSVGVLLMAYGSPADSDDIERYYTDIRRGRPPTAEQLCELRARYAAIGGTSALRTHTEAQVAAVRDELGTGFVVELGMRHAAPSIEDAVERLHAAGVDRVIGAVLAPHYSAMSVGVYLERARAAAGGTPFSGVDSWHAEPAIVDQLAARVRSSLRSVPESAIVVFTAHSLPARILEAGDPYVAQVNDTAAAVSARLGLGCGAWRVAWQSAAKTGERWLGPDVGDVIDELAGSGASGVVVCPVGFASDHLETLFDLDVLAATRAGEMGLPFARTAALGTDVAPVLADVVRRLYRQPGLVIGTIDDVADDFEAQVSGVASLNDPIRRALYQFVVNSVDAVSREQAAEGVGVQRALAAFHLDKLAEEGLLEFEFRRLTGRSGPGAGRPAKLYRRSDRQIDISLPPREYDIAAMLLAQAIDDAGPKGDVRAALGRASFAFGERMGAEAEARAGARASNKKRREALLEVLREHGFEPHVVNGDVVLANCPFHALAQQFTDLVCGMNLHLMEGVRSKISLKGGELQPRLEPEAGLCCVKFCGAA